MNSTDDDEWQTDSGASDNNECDDDKSETAHTNDNLETTNNKKSGKHWYIFCYFYFVLFVICSLILKKNQEKIYFS